MAETSLRAKITKSAVDRLAPGETLRDTELKGFGVRRKKDVASYFMQRKVGGQLRWFTIGMHGSPWTPETARREARRLMLTLAEGGDPRSIRRQKLEEPTVADAADQFMASHGVKLKPRTRVEYQRLFTRHIIPEFGRLKVRDVKKADVAQFHAALADTTSVANFAYAVFSKLMSWCEDMGYRPASSNPCRGIQKYRDVKRDRYLSRQEYARLGAALDQAEIDRSVSLFAVAAIRLLVLTGARLGEILTLQWSHVDLQRALLLLPDSKTGRKAIRLSVQAVAVLESLPRLRGNPYVIVGHTEGRHIVSLQGAWRTLKSKADLDDVRIHDLRHSFASMAAASRASLPMIGRLLGHASTQTTARYAHLADDPLQKLNDDVGTEIAAALKGSRGAASD